MKFFKITLPRGAGGLQYPPQYQAEIGDKAQDHLYYSENDTTYLLLAIKDADAVGIVRTNVVEITAIDAGTISQTYDDALIKITDEGMVRLCEMKVARNLQLTQDEEDALDPTNSRPGFVRRGRFHERVAVIVE